jgi:hypothetical protein
MSKASRGSALRQPSNIFLMVLAVVAALVIAGMVIARLHFAAADAAPAQSENSIPARLTAPSATDRKALLDIEIAAASASTRLTGTREDRAQAAGQLNEMAGNAEALGPGVPKDVRHAIVAQIARARDLVGQGETDAAVHALRELSNRLASGRSA